MKEILPANFHYLVFKFSYSFKKNKGRLIRKVSKRIFLRFRNFWDSLMYRFFFDQETLKKIFSQEFDFIDLSCARLQWSGTLVQRYNQIAIQFSYLGGLVFAGSLPQVDNVRYIKKINKNLYIVNPFIRPLIKDIEILAAQQKKKVLVRIQSTDFSTTSQDIFLWKNLGFKILYEYIDPFHEDISGPIPNFVLERHLKILKDETIYFCASAKSLFKEVPKERPHAFLSQNGVVPKHWSPIPYLPETSPKQLKLLKELKGMGLPILGYHGALAKWINYDLLKEISDTCNYNVLLIGEEYDNSLRESGLLNKKNIHFIGPVDHQILPFFSSFYDVSIVPFTFDKFAEGVSPIKLFEYMAIGKPIVVTANSEISQYKSCLVANNIADFLEKLKIACTLSKDDKYKAILSTEAQQNSWEKRCEDILVNCEIAAYSNEVNKIYFSSLSN